MLHQLIDLFLHLDKHLNVLAAAYPARTYALLAIVIFCETGLVVTPFLPGDSLLFAIGAVAASAGSPLSLPLVIVLMCLSANCGDLLNYTVGRRVGPAVFCRDTSLLFNKQYLLQAQAFYDRHGRKTIILARFVPIIRTFAPFVAGIGQMPFGRFVSFSVGGGALWVILLTLAGYFLNQIPFIRTHFQLVVLAVVIISLLPMAVHAMQNRRKGLAVDPAVLPPAVPGELA